VSVDCFPAVHEYAHHAFLLKRELGYVHSEWLLTTRLAMSLGSRWPCLNFLAIRSPSRRNRQSPSSLRLRAGLLLILSQVWVRSSGSQPPWPQLLRSLR